MEKNVTEADQTNTEGGEKKKMALWKKIAIVVAGLIVVVVVSANMLTAGVGKAADGFVNAMLTNQSSQAYEYFSFEAKEVVPEGEFDSIVEQLSSVLQDKAKQVSKEVFASTGSASTGTVVYEVVGSDGTYDITVNLVKEDGEWRVLNFDSVKQE